MNDLTVTVIVPVRNGTKVLPLCLDALRRQTYPADRFEVLVIDDESTDRTPQLVESTIAEWREGAVGAKLRLIRKAWAGAGAARNRGVAESSGDVVLFTDADCEPVSTWIEEMVRPLGDPAVQAVAGGYLTRQASPVARLAQAEFEDRYRRVAKHKYVDIAFTHSAAVRREAFLQSKGFDERIPNNADDLELSYRLAVSGHSIIFAPKGLVYHQHPATWADYIKKKIGRGYWRTLVFKRYPKKLASDSYTPQTLKVQILLMGLFVVMLATGLLFSSLVLALAVIPLAMTIASAIPFSVRLRGPLGLKMLAPLFLAVQAAAIGWGTFLGLFGRIEHYEVGGRKASVRA